MGIRHPLVHEIARDTYLINEFGLCNHYVLVGSQRALVIDCGMGYYDMVALIATITDKPYDVVITHGHPDHAGMMHQFDQVYMNEADLPLLPWAAKTDFNLDEFVWNNRLHVGDWQVWEVTEDMVNRGHKDTQVLSLHEGDVFDLGNRKVTAYALPGHTKGCMYLIDDMSRDVAVSTVLRGLLRIESQYGILYDRMFTGHSTYCGTLDVKANDIAVVRNLIGAYRSLLNGNPEIGWKRMQLFPDRPPHKVVLYGPEVQYPHENARGPMVCAGFNEELLWEEGEEHIVP